MSSRFFSNSEASASELLKNLEEMFTLYNMDSDINSFKYLPTDRYVTNCESVNEAGFFLSV